VSYPALAALDLLQVACFQRHDRTQVKTFDRPLGAAF